MRLPEEMAAMPDDKTTGSASYDADAPIQQEPDDLSLDEEPGYLTETGQAVGDDGSVVPIIGGLPAVEGSAWDIGASADERGSGLAEQQAGHEDQH
jgi:hypothetical protein